MSQQFMGVLASHAGTTQTTTVGITNPTYAARAGMWTHGAFGISVTTSTAGATFGVAVWGNATGVSIKLAEITGLMGSSVFVLPQVNEVNGVALGTTQSSQLGIVAPRSIVLTGVSAGIGLTFGCVVSAALLRI